MNGDGREFVELKQQFLDYRERQMEANTDIKARLTSIDASLSVLTPMITAHQERFKTLEEKCSIQGKTNMNRISRIETGILSAIGLIVALFVTGVWQVVFPPKAS